MRVAIVGLIVSAGGIAGAQPSELPLANWQHSMWTGRSGPPVPGSYFLLGSPDGYLWLSASNCLLRFDGVRFTVFDSATTPALRSKESGEFVPTYLDRQGVMWIAGPRGERITYKDGRFRHAFTLHAGGDPITEDERGIIWMIDGKPQRVENGRPSPVPMPAAIPATDVWSFRVDTGGGMWIGTHGHGLWHVSRSGETRQYGTGEIRPLIVSRDGTLWAVGTQLNGTARLEGNRWVPLRLPNDSVRVFGRFAVEDGEGAVWFQTNARGVVRYRKGMLDTFTPSDGLSDSRVNDVYVDTAGVVWVSTDAGLDRLRPAAFAPLDPAHLVVGGIGATAAPDAGGAMWVTDRSAHSVLLLDGGILRNGARPLVAKRFRFGNDENVSLLAASPRGGAWIKPFVSDLVYLETDGTRETFGARSGLPNVRIFGGVETRDGALWMELQGGRFGRLRNGKYKAISIAGKDRPGATAYIEDGRGRLWVAWGDQPNLAVFVGDSIVANVAVPTEHVDYFAPEHGDTLWAASEFGLVRIIGTKAVKVGIPALQRVLVSNLAIGVAQGSLWIGSAAGIARVSLAELHRAADGDPIRIVPHMFDVLDGLERDRAARMTWQSVLVGRDGRVWINTAAGLAMANPTPRMAARLQPRVLIEEVTLDGTPVTDVRQIRAKPGRLDIHFTATGLELPERARLQYRLLNSDRDWVDASVPRVASYSRLRPASYVFNVRALNESGVVSASEQTLRFRVPPAWDQAWWFFALIAAAIAATATGATVAWQHRRTRLAAEHAQARFDATLAERTRVARELHDTLLGDMAGVAMQLSAGAHRAQTVGGANAPIVELLSTLSGQVQRSLVEARRSVTAMRTEQPNETRPLHEQLDGAAQRTFAQSGIVASVKQLGSARPYPPAVEAEILGIASEAMANARQHAGCRTVTIMCNYAPRELELRVRDDGRGFDPAQGTPPGHWGLVGMRERATSIGGKLSVTSAASAGTEVVLVVPGGPGRWTWWNRSIRT